MAKKKVQSVFRDLYPEDQAAEMEMRSLLLQGLGNWLAGADMTQTEAAKVLGITQAQGIGHQAWKDQFLQPRPARSVSRQGWAQSEAAPRRVRDDAACGSFESASADSEGWSG